MLSEFAEIIKYLEKTGTPYQLWAEDFIESDSVELGAVKTVSIRETAHLNFDAEGRLVSSSTNSANSVIPRQPISTSAKLSKIQNQQNG